MNDRRFMGLILAIILIFGGVAITAAIVSNMDKEPTLHEDIQIVNDIRKGYSSIERYTYFEAEHDGTMIMYYNKDQRLTYSCYDDGVSFKDPSCMYVKAGRIYKIQWTIRHVDYDDSYPQVYTNTRYYC